MMAESEAWVMIPLLKNNGTECVLDMRPLVLCKDCKHYNKSENDNVSECMIQMGYFPTTDNWFCADGERKTE